jgi:hypothetical protein
MIPNGDAWAVQFLKKEPVDYTERGWLEAYAAVLSCCKPDLSAQEIDRLTREAFQREGHWNNPKIAAGCDAVFGPIEPPLVPSQAASRCS